MARALTSVAQQTFKDFELIIVDGFSTDGTFEAAQAFEQEHSNVRVVQEEARGIAAAMNVGVRLASGEYLMHLHSDDWFFDDKVLMDVDAFLQKNNPDWVYGKVNVVEENGATIGEWPKKNMFHTSSKKLWGSYLLNFYNFIPHQSVFIKKAVFEKYGLFDESLKSAMDQELWLRIRKQTSWEFYNRVMSNYTLRSGAASSTREQRDNNKKNYTAVQKRYLNWLERPIAWFINAVVFSRTGNYR